MAMRRGPGNEQQPSELLGNRNHGNHAGAVSSSDHRSRIWTEPKCASSVWRDSDANDLSPSSFKTASGRSYGVVVKLMLSGLRPWTPTARGYTGPAWTFKS